MRLLVLCLSVLLMHCGKKYHDFEGPIRGSLVTPHTVEVDTTVYGILHIKGEYTQDLVSHEGYCFMYTVEGDEYWPSCWDSFPGGKIAFPIMFPKWWWMYKKGWDRSERNFGDYEEEDTYRAMTYDLFEDYDDSIHGKVTAELWAAKPDPKDPLKWIPTKRLAHGSRSIRIDCRSCTQPVR